MRLIRNLTLLTVIVQILLSCSTHEGYQIEGNVTGIPDSTMIYLKNLSTEEEIDSALVLNNHFVLKGVLPETPESFWLHFNLDKKFHYTNLLIGNEKVTLQADITDFPWHVKIKGSKNQDEYNKFRNLRKTFDIKRDSLVKYFFSLSDSLRTLKNKEIWEEIKAIDDTVDKIIDSAIKENINSYAGVINLGFRKKEFHRDTVAKLYNNLPEDIKTSKYGKIIKVYLDNPIPKVGDKCYDFEAYNKLGEKVSLFDMKEKYILLDFTSTYCGPCMKSAKELHKIHETYKDSIAIVSFSCDANKEVWQEFLKRDSVTWTSLWDGKGRMSETYIKYGISGVPTFLLLSPERTILKKWSGYGDGIIERKIKNTFKKKSKK